MLCSHLLEYFNIFFFFSFSSFPISTRCSSLLNPHTLHFFPLQAPIPPLTTNPSPYPALTTLFILYPSLSLYYLIFPLHCLSIFLCLKHQDPWSPILDFDFVAVIDKTTLSPWLGFVNGFIFILMNRFWFCWWLMNRFCWWMGLVDGWWMGFVDGCSVLLMNGFC